jgi:hypothetical protein
MTETENKEGSDMKSGVFPAFSTSNPYEGNGMSLRDWFAGQVVGNVASDPTVGKHIQNNNMSAEQVGTHIARIAFAIADAMIAERLK